MRVGFRFFPQSGEGRRQLAVIGVLLAFAFVIVIGTSIVLAAIGEVARHANALDDERSRETTTGALNTFRFQLRATLNDYAAWDDAAQYVYATDGMTWTVGNYGEMTVNSDLFDTAIVLTAGKQVLMAYHDGAVMTAPIGSYFDPALWALFDEARKGDAAGLPEANGFVQTADGIAAVGVALIRNKDGAFSRDPEQARYLVFARHLNDETVAKLSEVYVISGLRLVGPDMRGPYSVQIDDAAGKVLGQFVWTSRAPGDVSFAQVRPQVLIAASLVVGFFLALLLIGVVAMRRLREDETRAQSLALQDRLSGLLNRAGLYAGLERLIGTARQQRTDVLLFYLDLDGFKEVNDAYGHGTGDQLIRGVAAGLKILVPADALLARIGGDEFAMAFSTSDIDAVTERLGETILQFFAEPFVLGERVATVGTSIGVSSSPIGIVDCDEALRRADMAMYKAKESGRGRFVRYHPDMDANRQERNAMEVDLRRSIETQSIEIAYQPLVAAAGHRMTGVEALARWNRPGHGPVPPDIFIPIAETTGLIDALGLFVLRKTCLEALNWPGLDIAVNVSPGQFRNPAFTANVAAVIRETTIDPARITLELTEGFCIQNPARARWTIGKLQALGVQVALDDFGAGFSSVGYLRQFGFDRMKIDRSLVSTVTESARARDMLHATVALARSLDIPVTAEGIENEEQARILQLCGCDALQGYFFGRPVPATAIRERLAAGISAGRSAA